MGIERGQMRQRVYVDDKRNRIMLDSDKYGKRKRLSTGKEADKRWIKYYEANFDVEYDKLYFKDDHSKPIGMLFREYGEEVLNVTRMKRTARSHKRNLSILDEAVKYFGERVDITSFNRRVCEKWQSDMLNLYAEKTVATKRAVLYMIFDFAIDDELLKRNPFHRIDAPKRPKDMGITILQKKRAPVWWSFEEVTKILESSKNQDLNFFQLTAYTGLRGGEMVALRWRNLDFEKNIIKVVEAIADGKVGLPKSGKSRNVVMFPLAREALLRQQKRTGLGEYVFLTQYGKRYNTPATITVRLELLTKSLGLEPGGLHDLRRYYNTLLKQLGYQDAFVEQQLGHSDSRVNKEHYTGLITADVQEFNSKLKTFVG